MRQFLFASFLTVSVSLVVSGCATSPAEPEALVANPNQQFETLANEAWNYNRMQYPSVLARQGDASAAGKLMDNSPEALAARYRARKAFYEQLEAIDPNTLSENKDRKSTRLNSSHVRISYAVFCLK